MYVRKQDIEEENNVLLIRADVRLCIQILIQTRVSCYDT